MTILKNTKLKKKSVDEKKLMIKVIIKVGLNQNKKKEKKY